ncbi:MAG TPA: hypothetical protein VIJ18_13695 [Microbacteriaceae bacterium]
MGTPLVTAPTPMGSPWRAVLRRPFRRRAIGLLVAAVLAAAFLWYLGMDAWHAALVAAAVIALGLSWQLIPDNPASGWPVEVSVRADGNRGDVTRLSWTLRTRRGRVQPGALIRVRLLAARRLEPHELDVDDPADEAAVTALIGASTYRTLRPNPASLPTFYQIERCLDGLAQLVDPGSGVADPPSRAAITQLGRLFDGAATTLTDALTRRAPTRRGLTRKRTP